MKTIHTEFSKELKYDVTVHVPDDMKLVEEHGTYYVEVIESPFPNFPPMCLRLSLQAAARRGLVTYDPIEIIEIHTRKAHAEKSVNDTEAA